MAEVHRAEATNGFVMVSTFSGAGGTCTGFKLAGFDIRYASEFMKEARETYVANYPNAFVDARDIREVNAREILNICRIKVRELDVLEGSPPCRSFSSAGKKEEGWGKEKIYSKGTKQRTDDLFQEYVRLLKELKPKMFVAENVKGLLEGNARYHFKIFYDLMVEAGYHVEVQLLNAGRLGVPQNRPRVIFIGVRRDLYEQTGVGPQFPKPFPQSYTLKDALEQEMAPSESRPLTPQSRVLWEKAPSYKGRLGDVMEKEYGKRSYFTFVRLAWDEPCPTILQSGSSMLHPSEPRTMSISELKRVSAFPDDFILSGSFYDQWERIGRAVPPLMAYHIAESIKATLHLINAHLAAGTRQEKVEPPVVIEPEKSKAKKSAVSTETGRPKSVLKSRAMKPKLGRKA